MSKKPKIIIWDIETSLMAVSTFQLKNDYIHHSNILQDWYIICACWKEHGKSKVHAVSLADNLKRFKKDPSDDYEIVKALRSVLEDADIIVHHNGDRFDLRKLNARLIYHSLPPLPRINAVDTLKEVRKIASFTSNRLDYLGEHLGYGGKTTTSSGLWLRVLRGDVDAVNEMVRYNKRDVTLLEKIYQRLRPYIKNHPNVSAGEVFGCPNCGSEHLQSRGITRTRAGTVYGRLCCTDCGSWSRTRKQEKSYGKPKTNSQ